MTLDDPHSVHGPAEAASRPFPRSRVLVLLHDRTESCQAPSERPADTESPLDLAVALAEDGFEICLIAKEPAAIARLFGHLDRLRIVAGRWPENRMPQPMEIDAIRATIEGFDPDHIVLFSQVLHLPLLASALHPRPYLLRWAGCRQRILPPDIETSTGLTPETETVARLLWNAQDVLVADRGTEEDIERFARTVRCIPPGVTLGPPQRHAHVIGDISTDATASDGAMADAARAGTVQIWRRRDGLLKLAKWMAAGSAVIATEGDGRLIVPGKTAVLATADDPAALDRLKADLLADSARCRRLAMRARRQVARLASWPAVMDRCYRPLLKPTGLARGLQVDASPIAAQRATAITALVTVRDESDAAAVPHCLAGLLNATATATLEVVLIDRRDPRTNAPPLPVVPGVRVVIVPRPAAERALHDAPGPSFRDAVSIATGDWLAFVAVQCSPPAGAFDALIEAAAGWRMAMAAPEQSTFNEGETCNQTDPLRTAAEHDLFSTRLLICHRSALRHLRVGEPYRESGDCFWVSGRSARAGWRGVWVNLEQVQVEVAGCGSERRPMVQTLAASRLPSQTTFRSAPALPPPVISLCMIVRDAARTLPACLASIRPFVGEMIVVDTGSVDGTPAIARRFGAVVVHEPWGGDFSAARNASLARARGQWIFWMDADDTIDADMGRKLAALAARPVEAHVLGYILQVHCPSEQGDATRVDHVKLFRNRPDLRFEGRIHEQILPAIRRAGGEVVWTDLSVRHSGADHTAGGRRRKQARDLRLLRLDDRDRPGHSFVQFNMGMTLLDAGRNAEAVHWLTAAAATARAGDSHLAKVRALLAAALAATTRPAEALAVCRQGLALQPDDAELNFRAGLLSHRLGRLDDAASFYKDAMKPRPRRLASVDPALGGYKARYNLAAVYLDQGRLEAALSVYRDVVTEAPDWPLGRAALNELESKLRQSASTETPTNGHSAAIGWLGGEIHVGR